MALESGRELGHYTISEKIGEGGMGEVYRAHDRKLARDVAIKILPHELSGEPERLARFQREAQVLASLNHPHIAAIYGLEEVDGLRFLVLELVEGADLAERLSQGPLPQEQALDVARQIAEALEAAHERGVVHRDLKPANVKLTPEGQVKVLDFGLAKALLSGAASQSDTSRSPTITSLSTRDGVILGTAAYMSPEQARGGHVDRRADIWSFGLVLLELLTGEHPFREPTVSDTLASILRAEPEWGRLLGGVPPSLRRLLQRCLDKDPRRRLRDIGEARVALESIGDGTDVEGTPLSSAPSSGSRTRLAVLLAVVVVLTAVVTAALVHGLRNGPADPVARQFELVRGGFDYRPIAPPVIAPDGRKIVFARSDRLWIRRLDRLDPIELPGTEAATKPSWSRDSESVLFVANGDLKSVPITGGGATPIAFGIGDIVSAGGLGVHRDGRIVYATGNTGLTEVSAHGGSTRSLARPNGDTEADYHEPSVLPDGSILFVVHRAPQGPDTIAVFDGTKVRYVLTEDSERLSDPVYSATGHIVFSRSGPRGGLWAVPFSLESLEVTGEPLLLTTDGRYPSVSDDGTLLYVLGASVGTRQLVWVDRRGQVLEPVGPSQAGVSSPALSPDDSRVVVMAEEQEIGNLWVYDLARDSRSRLTFGTAMDWDPVWTPDGESIVFWEGTSRALSRKAADGSGETVRLVRQDLLDSGVPSLSADGRWMAFWAKPTGEAQDIWVLALTGDGTAEPLLASPAAENNPRISPDGRFLAYASDASGRNEIYLTRFPQAEGKWQVSVDGGTLPVWSPDGSELFYLQVTKMMQVDVTLGSTPRLGTPRALFDASELGLDVLGNSRFTISSDGQRFLIPREVRTPGAEPGIVIHYGWSLPFRGAN